MLVSHMAPYGEGSGGGAGGEARALTAAQAAELAVACADLGATDRRLWDVLITRMAQPDPQGAAPARPTAAGGDGAVAAGSGASAAAEAEAVGEAAQVWTLALAVRSAEACGQGAHPGLAGLRHALSAAAARGLRALDEPAGAEAEAEARPAPPPASSALGEAGRPVLRPPSLGLQILAEGAAAELLGGANGRVIPEEEAAAAAAADLAERLQRRLLADPRALAGELCELRLGSDASAETKGAQAAPLTAPFATTTGAASLLRIALGAWRAGAAGASGAGGPAEAGPADAVLLEEAEALLLACGQRLAPQAAPGITGTSERSKALAPGTKRQRRLWGGEEQAREGPGMGRVLVPAPGLVRHGPAREAVWAALRRALAEQPQPSSERVPGPSDALEASRTRVLCELSRLAASSLLGVQAEVIGHRPAFTHGWYWGCAELTTLLQAGRVLAQLQQREGATTAGTKALELSAEASLGRELLALAERATRALVKPGLGAARRAAAAVLRGETGGLPPPTEPAHDMERWVELLSLLLANGCHDVHIIAGTLERLEQHAQAAAASAGAAGADTEAEAEAASRARSRGVDAVVGWVLSSSPTGAGGEGPGWAHKSPATLVRLADALLGATVPGTGGAAGTETAWAADGPGAAAAGRAVEAAQKLLMAAAGAIRPQDVTLTAAWLRAASVLQLASGDSAVSEEARAMGSRAESFLHAAIERRQAGGEGRAAVPAEAGWLALGAANLLAATVPLVAAGLAPPSLAEACLAALSEPAADGGGWLQHKGETVLPAVAALQALADARVVPDARLLMPLVKTATAAADAGVYPPGRPADPAAVVLPPPERAATLAAVAALAAAAAARGADSAAALRGAVVRLRESTKAVVALSTSTSGAVTPAPAEVAAPVAFEEWLRRGSRSRPTPPRQTRIFPAFSLHDLAAACTALAKVDLLDAATVQELLLPLARPGAREGQAGVQEAAEIAVTGLQRGQGQVQGASMDPVADAAAAGRLLPLTATALGCSGAAAAAAARRAVLRSADGDLGAAEGGAGAGAAAGAGAKGVAALLPAGMDGEQARAASSVAAWLAQCVVGGGDGGGAAAAAAAEQLPAELLAAALVAAQDVAAAAAAAAAPGFGAGASRRRLFDGADCHGGAAGQVAEADVAARREQSGPATVEAEADASHLLERLREASVARLLVHKLNTLPLDLLAALALQLPPPPSHDVRAIDVANEASASETGPVGGSGDARAQLAERILTALRDRLLTAAEAHVTPLAAAAGSLASLAAAGWPLAAEPALAAALVEGVGFRLKEADGADGAVEAAVSALAAALAAGGGAPWVRRCVAAGVLDELADAVQWHRRHRPDAFGLERLLAAAAHVHAVCTATAPLAFSGPQPGTRLLQVLGRTLAGRVPGLSPEQLVGLAQVFAPPAVRDPHLLARLVDAATAPAPAGPADPGAATPAAESTEAEGPKVAQPLCSDDQLLALAQALYAGGVRDRGLNAPLAAALAGRAAASPPGAMSAWTLQSAAGLLRALRLHSDAAILEQAFVRSFGPSGGGGGRRRN
ncbi:hypothetical protein HYH03_012605 [Edaphochlamys debaryana]|uniref:Uncharacterized protein n=1 Tax=Edaphochlamys debaryana TaxID=47281 RepID=A0A835XSD3_9CHLO|nr:hypothetical protein HYH03_012605 [Edaphochlamys debaryana]|eukprot:KAG2488805.1 hypothetical protein HYH03_012605 [Edaphochlamys debaryana]